MAPANPFREPGASRPEPSTSTMTLSPEGHKPSVPEAEQGHGATVAQSSSSFRASPIQPDPTGLDDELPPAYTPSPNAYQGESTVEYGPARPFQPPPQRPQHQQPLPQSIRPQSTGWAPTTSQSSYGREPPSLLQQLTGHIVTQLNNATERLNAQSTGSRPGWSGYPGQQHSGSHTPLTAQHSGQPPPLPSRPSHNGHLSPPPSNHTPDRRSTPSPLPQHNDGKPTSTPVPGHPLLRGGQLLVYPSGYECRKCKNVGYRHNDPSHPCKRCWRKYSRPYSGPMTYSSFEPNAPGREILQQPLPMLQAAGPSRPPPRPPQHSGFNNGPPPMRPAISGFRGAPESNARVFVAGDPRIGGRLCWRCGGSGSISLLFLEDTCPTCGGIGRVFS